MDKLLKDFGLEAYAANFRELGLNTPLKISSTTPDDTEGLKMKIIHKKKLTKMLNFLSENPPAAEADDKNLPPISDSGDDDEQDSEDEEEKSAGGEAEVSDSELSSQGGSVQRGSDSDTTGNNNNFMSYMGNEPSPSSSSSSGGGSSGRLPVVKAKKEEQKKKRAMFAVDDSPPPPPSNKAGVSFGGSDDDDDGSSRSGRSGSSSSQHRGRQGAAGAGGAPKMPKSATMMLFSGGGRQTPPEPEYDDEDEEDGGDDYNEEDEQYDGGEDYDAYGSGNGDGGYGRKEEEEEDERFYPRREEVPEYIPTPKSEVHRVSALLEAEEEKEHLLVASTVMKTKELDSFRFKLAAAQASLKAAQELNASKGASGVATLAKLDVHLAADVAETTMLAEKEARAKASVTDLNEQDEDLDDQLELDKDSLEAKSQEVGAFLRKNEEIEAEKRALLQLIEDTKQKLEVKKWGLSVARRHMRVSKASFGMDKGPTKYSNVRSTLYK